MSESTPTGPIHLGFLTVFQEGNGFLGGYLATNSWGRPLEFRLSTAVQPNRVQSILYGTTLQEYLCADLIGKTLIEKCSTSVHLLITDSLDVLPIRSRLEVPVLAVLPPENQDVSFLPAERVTRLPREKLSTALYFDPRKQGDLEQIQALLDRIDTSLDFAEPFSRIREAMVEARKMGVTSRAA
ncbi:MAG: hypothetical protein K8T89_04740 [Planctomycetes bacterium]|nr:hypothetical protein [Planctomycetota bacterium]